MGVSDNCVCVECGEGFEAKTAFATLCSPKCVQRRYRRTDKGKASVLAFNERVKRIGIKKVCIFCNDKFVTARKSQVFCSKCSVAGKGGYYAQKKHRLKYPVKAKARGRLSKRIQRGASMKKEPCDACGKEAGAHHHNYEKPLDVVWLCKEHHAMMHKFD